MIKIKEWESHMFKHILKLISPYISLIALFIIIFSSIQVFSGKVSKDSYILMTNIFTAVWFVFSPFWLIKGEKSKNI